MFRELALVRVGRLCKSAYELHHHERFAQKLGISNAQLDRLRSGDFSDDFAVAERAVLEIHR